MSGIIIKAAVVDTIYINPTLRALLCILAAFLVSLELKEEALYQLQYQSLLAVVDLVYRHSIYRTLHLV